MSIHAGSGRRPLAQLRRRQERHRFLLGRIESATDRLDRLRVELLALESDIAHLESLAAAPGASSSAPAGGAQRAATLIFNRAAGTGNGGGDDAGRLDRIVRGLRAHGIEARVELNEGGSSAMAAAERAVRAHAPLLLVAGGDGTIEEVASRLVGSDTVLGIVPSGTMNNLARSLGVPFDVEEACALIGMGTVRRIDVGRMISGETPKTEYFLEGAGVGLSALAAYAGEAMEKHRWRVLPRALGRLFEHKAGVLQVELDDTTLEVTSDLVTVSNAPLMGSNLLMVPGAKMDDGLLDVALYDGMNAGALVQHFLLAGRGQGDGLPTRRARRVRIVAERPLPSNSDTDVVAERRVVEIEVLPRQLAVIAGNGIGLTIPVEAAPPGPPLNGGPGVGEGKNGKDGSGHGG